MNLKPQTKPKQNWKEFGAENSKSQIKPNKPNKPKSKSFKNISWTMDT